MGAQQIVRDDRRLVRIAMPGGQVAVEIAACRDDPGLVQRDPEAYPVAEGAIQDLRIVREPPRTRVARPAPARVERLGEIPMVEGEHGLDPPLQQRIDQVSIEIQARLIHPPAALGEDPRPGHAEAVGVQTERRHQGDILAPAPVVVAGDIPGFAV